MNQNLFGIFAAVTVLLVNIPKIAEAIVDGKPAVNGQFPWAIALYLYDQFTCTASLIGPHTVLTAAHCVVFDGKTEPFRNFYGTIGDVNRTSPNATRIYFSNVTPHPAYNSKSNLNDIAVFQTKEEVVYSDTIGSICIAKASTHGTHYKKATAMGWGRIRTDGPLPDILMYVEQMELGYYNCEARLGIFYGQSTEAAKTQLCTRELIPQRNGVCEGDSGGPLVHLSSAKPPIQIGVTAYGSGKFGCGTRIIPSVSTSVSAYVSFILGASDGDDICTL